MVPLCAYAHKLNLGLTEIMKNLLYWLVNGLKAFISAANTFENQLCIKQIIRSRVSIRNYTCSPPPKKKKEIIHVPWFQKVHKLRRKMKIKITTLAVTRSHPFLFIAILLMGRKNCCICLCVYMFLLQGWW